MSETAEPTVRKSITWAAGPCASVTLFDDGELRYHGEPNEAMRRFRLAVEPDLRKMARELHSAHTQLYMDMHKQALSAVHDMIKVVSANNKQIPPQMVNELVARVETLLVSCETAIGAYYNPSPVLVALELQRLHDAALGYEEDTDNEFG